MAAKSVYIFFRREGWYPIELRDDEEARRNAEHNPGTLKVERMDRRGKSVVVWRQQ